MTFGSGSTPTLTPDDAKALAKQCPALADVAPVVREGGYLPCPDHCLPHDVPWENFLYYEKLISEL